VAAITLRPEPSLVLIVMLMAPYAGAADGNFSPQRLFVTGIAIQGHVGTVQDEAGARIMIKLP